MKRNKATVKNISYGLTGGQIQLSLTGYPYLMFVKPEELHYGGKNCEISQLVVGSKIVFDYDSVPAVRRITNVTILSDGIREVDEDGDIVDSFGYYDVTPLYALQKDDGDLYESRGIPKYYGNIESAKEAKRLIIESPSDDDEDISDLTIVELSGTPGRFTEVEEQ